MSTQILFQPSHCYLKLYHHPWGNEDLAHLLVAPDSHHSPVTRLSQFVCFFLEDCGVLKICSSATGFSLVCPPFIKLIGHNLRGDSVRSGCTQRLLGTPKKNQQKMRISRGIPLKSHEQKLTSWSSDPFKQLSLKPLVWCRLSNHLAPAHPWKMLRPKLETSDVLLSKNRPTWKWDSWHAFCWLKWVMLYI